ncbi:MAG: NAD(P)-binding domain-containing protein, partial [Candidatus Ornithomonoglobus sp.]
MKVGFIGAGKCGMSLAAYFAGKGIEVYGFSSRHKTENSGFDFYSAEELVKRSGIIFVTVTDTAISEVWQEIRGL